MFYTYVLYSREYKKIYIGFTSDPEARLNHHNHPLNHGWTARFKSWEIIHLEEYQTKKEALTREKQLKSARGRKYIKSLIQSD
ncbi:MAG: GIY-YIG nuclease family protein [Actinomycetota bacterium]|jgi:putative endonuclease